MEKLLLSKYNGSLPCINHRAAILERESEKVEELLSLSKSLGLSKDTVSLMTVFLSQAGYLKRRYKVSDFESFNENKICTCDTMRNECELGDLCYTCTLSDNYANRYLNEEKQILGYCFSNINNRNIVSSIVNNRSHKLMRSYTRMGKDDSTATYLQLNQLIYNFLCTLFMIPEVIEGFYDEFINSIQNNDKLRMLNEEEKKYLKSYFISIYKSSENIKITQDNIVSLVKKLLSTKYKSNNSDKSAENTSKPVDKHIVKETFENHIIELPIFIELQTEDTELINIKHKEAEEECTESLDIKDSKDNDNSFKIDNDTQNSFIVDDDNLLNRISYQVICSYENVISVTTTENITALDYCLLGNNIVAIELIEDMENEYILLYLQKEKIYYIFNIKNKACHDMLDFYLSDKFSLKKVTYSSIRLLHRLNNNGFTTNNLYALNTMYQLKYCVSSEPIKYEEMIARLAANKLNVDKPMIIQGLKYYAFCYNEMFKNYSDIEKGELEKECNYEKMISDTFQVNDIIANVGSGSYCWTNGLYDGKNQYHFNFNHKLKYNINGFLIKSIYKNEEIEKNSYLDAYKDVCIKCIQSLAYLKCSPRLLDLSEKNGLIFFVGEDNYRTFFTVINRLLIKSGKKYLSSKPLIEIETERCYS